MIEVFFKGGPVMFPLLLCSLVSLTVVIERAIFWITVDIRRNEPKAEEVLTLFQNRDLSGIQAITQGTQNRIVKILVSGILHQDYSMTRAMEAASMDEVKQMRRFMGVMDTMITVAPLLGIFGTVIGIIASFEMLGTAGIENPQAVTAGIAQALITTAAGLGIAISTVFPFNYFNTKIEDALIRIESYATRLEILHERYNCQQAHTAEPKS